MKYKDREGKILGEEDLQDRFLKKLYGSRWGRALLKPLICPAVSKLGGRFLDSPLSIPLIRPFVKANRIDLSGCEKRRFSSYNDFFTRKLKSGERPVAKDEGTFISPCDGKLTVYPIRMDRHFCIKHTHYTLEELLRDEKLAKRYAGGDAWIFRLSVDDYHRYCYVADGYQSGYRRIPGVFHTVNPAANDQFPIYKENTREYSVLRTETFRNVLMMEVGALMVGRIVNGPGNRNVKRGWEKGHFAFGGSTIILLTEAGAVCPDKDILRNTQLGYETAVRMGEKTGQACGKRPGSGIIDENEC